MDARKSATSRELLNDRPCVPPSGDINRKQMLTTSSIESELPSLFGVDWSDKARSTSHCWLPYCSTHSSSHCWLPYRSTHSSSVPTCVHTSCTTTPPNDADSFIQCGTCAISIHSAHITDLEKTTNVSKYITPCRPTFSDSTAPNDHSKYDQHYWSYIPKLKKFCMICRRKTLSRKLTNNNARILPSLEQSRSKHHSDSKRFEPSSGFICLWCSQSCHRWCWEGIDDNDTKEKCDYGKFKDIIVRPQWLYPVANSPARFQARFSDDIDARNSSFTPLIVFINRLSGGQKGEIIYHQLIRLLNPRQVFLLENDESIKQALEMYSSLRNIRILVCGGDGSIGWMLSTLANTFPSLNNPPVGICPLGTGNDLSRVLGWGWLYSNKQLLKTLSQISTAQPIALDRWQVDFEPLTSEAAIEDTRTTRRCCQYHPKFVRETDPPAYQNYRKPCNVRFTNYFSFGLDGAVVLDFHVKRMRDPSKFTSPFKNKLFYLNIARHYFLEFTLWRSWGLSSYMRLICDGKDMTDSLRHCHTIVLLNIPSYGSGAHPWSKTYAPSDPVVSTDPYEINRSDQMNPITTDDGKPSDYMYKTHKLTTVDTSSTIRSSATLVAGNRMQIQSISDKKIEVVGLDSIQMALIHLGLRGRRIAQCREVRIELIRSMPVHMDGDPFYLAHSTAVNVTHAGQVLVLRNENR